MEHPRFLVNVADLVRLEMGSLVWGGAGRATTTFII